MLGKTSELVLMARKRSKKWQQKFIFVTGGVVSSIGKGLAASSLGTLLESRSYKVSMMKFDPYINVDPGTMSPFQHGEVFVTDDGAETDLDLGHYERFTHSIIARSNSVTAGQVYESVISKERKGEYLGATVQVIPHITDEIKRKMYDGAQGAEIAIVEIGGTVGDIEGQPFLEAIRQMRTELGRENSIFIHVTLIPYIAAAGEMKSKPTQHSVKELRQLGIQPDFLVCRTDRPMEEGLAKKIAQFCNVNCENVISAEDASSIYEVPILLSKQKMDQKVCDRLNLKSAKPDLKAWKKMLNTLEKPKYKTTIAIVGKYVELTESYKSLNEALVHGGIANQSKVKLVYINSEKITSRNILKQLSGVDGILVPGGFGNRGVNGKLLAIQYARENGIPFLGICLGMQIAAIEYARNVCGINDAQSREFQKNVKNAVIDIMEDQKSKTKKGGTMRLGAYACKLVPGSLVHTIYGEKMIFERHRHRFEFNNKYIPLFEKNGMELSGINPESNLVEIIELKEHPWFVGVQFHPEFKSKPIEPHPLFSDFITACLEYYFSSSKNKQKPRNIKSAKHRVGKISSLKKKLVKKKNSKKASKKSTKKTTKISKKKIEKKTTRSAKR